MKRKPDKYGRSLDVPPQDERRERRYRREQNTSRLVRETIFALKPKRFTGNIIWNLIRLTWVTRSKDHWKVLKLPALAELFNQEASRSSELKISIEQMRLPEMVAQAASQPTGFVNAYNAYRNATLDWCEANEADLNELLRATLSLDGNDEARFKLADSIALLPGISQKNGKMNAANAITPLLACLDPMSRFPIINGLVRKSLGFKQLHLAGKSVREQVTALTGSIWHRRRI
jgi:hypothetical protein